MANRVVVSICGEDYTFVAEESVAYTQRVATYVDEQMKELFRWGATEEKYWQVQI